MIPKYKILSVLIFSLIGISAQPLSSGSGKEKSAGMLDARKYKDQGNYSEAISQLFRTLNMAERDKDLNRMYEALYSIGEINSTMQYHRRGLDYLRRAKAIADKLNDKYKILSAECGIGILYTALKKYDSAIYNHTIVLEKAKLNKDTFHLLMAYNNLGNVHIELNVPEKSRQYYEAALKLSESRKDTIERVTIMLNLAESLLKLRSCDSALRIMKMALKLKREIPLDLEDEIYSVLTSIYEQKENYKYANQSLHKRIEILKSVYAVQSNKIVNELESKYQLEKKQKEILSLVLEKRKKEISLKENERKIKYRNLLLFVFMALLLVTFIFFYFLYKQFQAKRNMNKTLELQNKAIREQKHRLEDTLESNRKLQRALKHDLGFYMQSALKKQMNPHFIFNSLISVQRFILQNDKLSASNYLADFSVLMRRVLENSQKELITYNEELNTLRLYIELEQRRFDGKFSYCEDIDSNIDLIACKIPPFILQPYIENAIWHGLLHKREEGHLHLKLKLSEEGNFVRCTIRDDGIGRKASNNRELKTNNYESLGLKITDKRIQAINSSSNLKLSVEILDLTAGNDVPVGTEVNLKIPLYSSTL